MAALLPTPWARIPRPSRTPGAGSAAELWVGIAGNGSLPIPVSRSEGRHALVLGETGMGKSSALLHVALQASRWSTVVLLDPVGDTARRLLRSLPRGSRTRAIWISPSSSPVPLNALTECRDAESGGRAPRGPNELVSALRRVRAARYGETPFWGPRIEETLHRALDAALRVPRATLSEALALLAGEGSVPVGLGEKAHDEAVALRRLAQTRPEEVDGARRLLTEVVRDPILRALLCEADARLGVRDLVGPRAIAVISGDAGQVGESTARYFVAIYLALIWSALLARPSPEKTFLLLDEAQWYLHESASEILRLGRRENVHLWTVTQGLASLPESAREALLTNCSEFVVFRGSPDDARIFGRWLGNPEADRLSTLPRGEALLLVEKGRDLAQVAVPFPAASEGDEEALREVARQSMEQFATRPPAERPGTLASVPGAPRPLLLAAATAAAPDGLVPTELRVRDLRTLFGASDEGLRALGGWLGREGLLLSVRRSADGSVWSLRPADVLQRVVPAPSKEELSRARTLWCMPAAGTPPGSP